MLSEYEELAVLEQGDDGAIVSIRGQGSPSVLLGCEYLCHLERVLSKAETELLAIPGASNDSALHLLCLEVKTLLATYHETCNKYLGGQPLEKSIASALAELEELRKRLDSL